MIKEEIITLVDKDDNVRGKIARRKAHTRDDAMHRVACVLVFNKKGDLLLQKRSKTVSMYPGCWTVSSAGHVAYGDTYINTALRELEEEVGLKVVESDLENIGQVNIPLPNDNELWQVYKCVTDQQNFTVQRDEVDEVKFVSTDALEQLIVDPNGNVCIRAVRLFNHFLFKQ